jgi:hypothetical protein
MKSMSRRGQFSLLLQAWSELEVTVTEKDDFGVATDADEKDVSVRARIDVCFASRLL